MLNSWRSAELSVDSRFHAGLVTATGPYTDQRLILVDYLLYVYTSAGFACWKKKHNLEFHTSTFQLDCGEDVSWGAGLSLCVCEHHHPASTRLKWLYDCMKNKRRQGWDDMSCQCTSRPLPIAPPGPCERASSQQWPHCLGTLEFTHSCTFECDLHLNTSPTAEEFLTCFYRWTRTSWKNPLPSSRWIEE